MLRALVLIWKPGEHLSTRSAVRDDDSNIISAQLQLKSTDAFDPGTWLMTLVTKPKEAQSPESRMTQADANPSVPRVSD